MKARILIMGAVALALAPSLASAQTPAPGNGQFNGQGYNHTNSGNATGQPGADCETLVLGDGSTPGNASSASGSPFNPDGNAGKKYAGEQAQNSRNSANSSQYDAACRPTPRSPQ